MASASRFRSTAPFYARFRPRYPAALFARIAERRGLDGGGRLLDLGCGPAFIAIGMARYFRELVGMDPDSEMLEIARQEAASAGVPLRLIQGGSEDLDRALGSFAMVAMGRSFHWMHRDATLRELDALITPDGCVALLGERATDERASSWRMVLDEAAARWAPEQAKARAFRRSPSWEKNETVLKRSSFNRVERLSVAYIRKTPLDDLIGRAYSMSVTSPAVLGEHRAAFEHDLRVGLLRLQPSGRFEEAVKAEALLAWRPRET